MEMNLFPTMSMADPVPTTVKDYLDEDEPIRGQTYCCISFVNPEDVLKSKEAFMLSKFVRGFSRVMSNLMDDLKTKYPSEADGLRIIRENHAFVFDEDAMQSDFSKFMVSNPQLEREFDEANGNRTSVRGIKVRGSYDTLDEAQRRAETLKRKDGGKFNILIGQVGCWMPITMDIDQIENQVYAETQLNTMMREYKKNAERTEEEYNKRKETLKKEAENHGKLVNAPPENAPVGDEGASSSNSASTSSPSEILDEISK